MIGCVVGVCFFVFKNVLVKKFEFILIIMNISLECLIS